MRIAIIGAGSIAFGMAALLAGHGHEPILWSPSGTSTRGLAGGMPLVASGVFEFAGPVGIAPDCPSALAGADAAVIAMPANGHRAAIDAMVPHLRDGMPMIISSHSSFGALYLSKCLAAHGVVLPIIVWGTTLLTARRKGDHTVQINTVRQKVDLATVPMSALDVGENLCTGLFGDRFVRREGLLAIALSNLNPQNHLGIALLNLTRMEKGETWGQGEHVTPAVGRMIEALDAERLAIADCLGLSVKTVREHFSQSFHIPLASVSDMNQEMHAQGRGGFGPMTADSRYVLEDVPFGLVPTALLGQMSGRPAILHEAGTRLLSAAYGMDLAQANDLLPALALDRLSIETLKELCAFGFAPRP